MVILKHRTDTGKRYTDYVASQPFSHYCVSVVDVFVLQNRIPAVNRNLTCTNWFCYRKYLLGRRFNSELESMHSKAKDLGLVPNTKKVMNWCTEIYLQGKLTAMIIIKLIFGKLINNTSEMLQDLKLFEHLVIRSK